MTKVFVWIPVFIGTVVALSLLLTLPVYWIVNSLFQPAVLIALFGVSHLTIWQALWLNILCTLLFKGSSGVSSK
jgi:hypothetical protein